METKLSNNLTGSSKVWVYAPNRILTEKEVEEIDLKAKMFASQWTAHKQQLNADGGVLYNCFLVLMIDESLTGVSGCSIDSSVRFIKEIGEKYQLDFFNRKLLYWLNTEDELQISSFESATQLYQSAVINKNTVVFNNLLNTKSGLEDSWKVNLGDSPLAKFILEAQPSFNLSL